MAVSSVSTTSIATWAYPAANAASPRVEQVAKGRATQEDEETKKDTSLARTNSSEESSSKDNEESSTPAGPKRADGTPMAPEEIQQLEQLKQTDREVRQHEMAHQVVGGPYAGGASYDYEAGPDGKRYAVAGEVPIDYGPVPNDPQATIEKNADRYRRRHGTCRPFAIRLPSSRPSASISIGGQARSSHAAQ